MLFASFHLRQSGRRNGPQRRKTPSHRMERRLTMPVTSTKKRLSATVYYLLTGLALAWPGLLATGWLLPEWRTGVTLTPLSLGTIHLLVLGFMLTVAFGVLYQIVPIAFQAPLVPRHVLYWHLPLHILSVVLMVTGFLTMRFPVVGIGGTLLIGVSAAYFTLILRSYVRARNKTFVHRNLVWPLLPLWLVLLIGVYQAFFPAYTDQRVVLSHALLGAFAFWAGLVLVFSYKLVPMFAISHGYRASLPRTASTYFSGILLVIVSWWPGLSSAAKALLYAGSALTVVGLLSLVVDMVAIVRARKRMRIVLPLLDAFVANACIVVGHAWVVICVAFGRTELVYPAAYLYWFGGLMPLMMAYMQKIVPFLWFEYRFSKRPERKTAPLIDKMVSKYVSQVGVVLYYLGVSVGLASLTVGGSTTAWTTIHWVSAVCLTLGSALLFVALRRVLFIGGPRPEDDATVP
jgi:hypothetical protein